MDGPPLFYIQTQYLISMAFAVPRAIAVKLAYPEHKVLAATGDGGFLMLGSELEIAVREHVPIVVLILEDQSYGLMENGSRARTPFFS